MLLVKSKNLIFDLDGTLWDSISCVVAGWNKVLESMDRVDAQFTFDDLKPLVGKSRVDIFDSLFDSLSEEELKTLDAGANDGMFAEIKARGAIIYPKVHETIDKLLDSDYTLAIVSNCQVGYIDLFLDQTKLHDSFVDQECWAATMRPKSENILSVMRRNKMEDAIYIGDTRTDQIAASEAAVPFIYASYGFGEVDENAPIYKTINAFSEMIQITNH